MEKGQEVVTQEPGPDQAGFRLSPQQEQLCGDEGRAQLLVHCVVDVGDADESAVRAALGALVDRHEILRTTLVRRPGMKLPSQVINARLDPVWSHAEGDAGGLDLATGPVVQAALLEVDGARRLGLTLPAACADARSLVLLALELRAELAAPGEAAGVEPVQYAYYAEWRSEVLASA